MVLDGRRVDVMFEDLNFEVKNGLTSISKISIQYWVTVYRYVDKKYHHMPYVHIANTLAIKSMSLLALTIFLKFYWIRKFF